MAVKEGYQNAYVFRGGLPEWIMAGYPTVTHETLPKVDIANMTVQELKQKIDAKEDFVLLDVRIPVDAAQYKLEASQLQFIPMNDLPKRYTEIPAGKPLVVIDKIGKRATMASRYLSAKGFDEIYKVGGGMNQWIKSGLPTKISK